MRALADLDQAWQIWVWAEMAQDLVHLLSVCNCGTFRDTKGTKGLQQPLASELHLHVVGSCW